MAKTGATASPITPAGPGRCRVVTAPEHSVQSVAIKGMPGQISAGYISYVTGNLSIIYGFARVAPQNGAADGAKTASLYRAMDGVEYKGTYLGTLSESVRGLACNISVNSAGAQWLARNTDSSTAGAAYITGWSSNWDAGDVNPTVNFAVRHSFIQPEN